MSVLCAAAVVVLFAFQASPQAVAAAEKLPDADRVVEVLKRGTATERQAMFAALARHASEGERYRPALLKALKDSDRSARQLAAMALAELGFADKVVVDELIAGMGQKRMPRYGREPDDALAAKDALVKLGAKAVSALIAALRDETYPGQILSLQALGEIGPPAKGALPAIKKGLESADRRSVHIWIEAKWRIDRDASFALQQLLPLLDDKEGRGCASAVQVLARMGSDAKEAVPAIIRALQRHKERELLWAVRELAPHARELALPALREALAETELADEAAIALHGLGAPAEEIVPRQLRRLAEFKEGCTTDPMRVAYVIVLYGSKAKAYAPDLIGSLKHTHPSVRRAAAWGVCRIGADVDSVRAVLQQALEDKEKDVAEEVARSLKVLDQAGSPR